MPKNSSHSKSESDKHNKKGHQVLKTPQYQRMLDSYKHDFLELSSYHEYKEAEWAYFYAYPEYFDPVPVAGLVGPNELIFTETKFISVTTGPQGNYLLHFCPGAGTRTTPAVPATQNQAAIPEGVQHAVWLAGSSNPGSAYDLAELAGWEGSAVAADGRCIGAYMMVEAPPTASALFKHREYVRDRKTPPYAIHIDVSGAESKALRRNTIFRFRAASYGSLLGGGGPQEYFAHEILFYNLPPNTAISLTIRRTFQGRLKIPVQFFKYIEGKSNVEFKKSKKVASELIASMPKYLENHPLRDAMEYHEYLFSNKGVKKSLFPKKEEIESMMAPINLPNIGRINLNIASRHAEIINNKHDSHRSSHGTHRYHGQSDYHLNRTGYQGRHAHHGYHHEDNEDEHKVRNQSRMHDIDTALLDENGRLQEISDAELEAIPEVLQDHLMDRYAPHKKHRNHKKD